MFGRCELRSTVVFKRRPNEASGAARDNRLDIFRRHRHHDVVDTHGLDRGRVGCLLVLLMRSFPILASALAGETGG